jgi:hypothetical protein
MFRGMVRFRTPNRDIALSVSEVAVVQPPERGDGMSGRHDIKVRTFFPGSSNEAGRCGMVLRRNYIREPERRGRSRYRDGDVGRDAACPVGDRPGPRCDGRTRVNAGTGTGGGNWENGSLILNNGAEFCNNCRLTV